MKTWKYLVVIRLYSPISENTERALPGPVRQRKTLFGEPWGYGLAFQPHQHVRGASCTNECPREHRQLVECLFES